MAIYNHTY